MRPPRILYVHAEGDANVPITQTAIECATNGPKTWIGEDTYLLSRKNFVRVLLLDYSIAFDLINHHMIILQKLTNIVLPDHCDLVRWMVAYIPAWPGASREGSVP